MRVLLLPRRLCRPRQAFARTANATATLAALTALLRETQCEVVELLVRKASLEDVFLALTRDEADDRRQDAFVSQLVL
jgi:hypothetical protein